MPAGVRGQQVPHASGGMPPVVQLAQSEPPRLRVPWVVLLLWAVVKWAALGLVLAAKYWPVSGPVGLLAVAWLWVGWWAPLVLVVLVAGVAGVWRVLDRGSFRRWCWWPVLGRWRRWRYRRRWYAAMSLAGLVVAFDGHELMPRLRRVVCRGGVDVLSVRPVSGQTLADFAAGVERFESTFGAAGVRVRSGRGGLVLLSVIRRDPLAAPVGLLPVVREPDVRALPVGVREDGQPYGVCLAGSHVLVAGATGAGKGSVVWSLVRSLAGGVAAGHVELWGVDPKGGMELSTGGDLFAHLACDDFEAMAELVDKAASLAQARAASLRGRVRQHTPTEDSPLVVLVVDELAALTSYLTDRKLKERIRNSLSLVLSQGRAVGVHVVAALQDPRKEVLPFRDLFPTRIALRLAEAGQVDMVLGDGMRERGAEADRIPEALPGVAYVVLDGDPTPVRVRFSYLSDDDIREAAQTYGRSRLRVVDGEAVSDARGARDEFEAVA